MARRRAAILAATFAALCAFAAALAFRIEVRTDLGFFLPRAPSPTARLVAEGLREGPAAGLILLAIAGGSAEARERASDALAGALSRSNRFAFVANGRPRIREADLRRLLPYRYLLNPPISPADFTVEALRADLKRALGALSTSAGAAAKRLVPADPTFRIAEIAASWAPPQGPRLRNGVWVSRDGDLALLVARSLAPPFDLARQKESLDVIESSFARVGGADGLRLVMSGPSVFASLTREAIQWEVQWLTVAALVLVAGLLFAAFRSPLLLAVLLLPIAAGVLGGAAAVQAVFGQVHGVTLAYGSTLIGVAIDYPIHLAAHGTREVPAPIAVRRIWPTMRLGALTTAAAFLPLTLSSFPGLSQLGVFTLAGLVIAAAVTRWLLPGLSPESGGPSLWEERLHAAGTAAVARWTSIAAAVAVLIAALYFTTREGSPWEDDLASLSPVPRESLRFDRALREELRAPDVRRLIVVEGATAEQVLRRSEDLEPRLRAFVRDGALAGFDMAARYVPSMRAQKARQAALPDARSLRSRLDAALRGLPFRPDLFDPFLADVEGTRTGPAVPFEEIAGGRLGARTAPLLFHRDGRWVGLIQLAGVVDPGAVAALTAGGNGPRTTYVDLKEESDRLMAGYRDEALNWLAVGALAALAMLIVGLRRADLVVRVMAPICVSVFLTAAVLAATGNDLSMLHLLALLLVAGLGLDYGLFFNRPFVSTEDAQRTVKAVVLCNLTTIMVFSILAFSRLAVLNSIGKTVAIGAALSLLLCYGMRRKASPGPN